MRVDRRAYDSIFVDINSSRPCLFPVDWAGEFNHAHGLAGLLERDREWDTQPKVAVDLDPELAGVQRADGLSLFDPLQTVG